MDQDRIAVHRSSVDDKYTLLQTLDLSLTMPDGNSHSLRHRNGPKSTPALFNKEKRGQAPQSYTLTWNELEEWQKDNEYIVSGYRRYVPAQRAKRIQSHTDLNQGYNAIGRAAWNPCMDV